MADLANEPRDTGAETIQLEEENVEDDMPVQPVRPPSKPKKIEKQMAKREALLASKGHSAQ